MILGIKKKNTLSVSKTNLIFLYIKIIKIVNRTITPEKSVISYYLFSLLKICKIVVVNREIYKKVVYILYIPIIKTKTKNNITITRIFGLTIYKASKVLQQSDLFDKLLEKVNDRYEYDVSELRILIKSVASGLREIKRLESKLNKM